MKKVLPAAILCLLLAATSCSKDEQFNNYATGDRGPELHYVEWTRMVEETIWDENGTIIYSVKSTYDDNGRLIEHNYYKLKLITDMSPDQEHYYDFVYDGLRCTCTKDSYAFGHQVREGDKVVMEFYDDSFLLDKLKYRKDDYSFKYHRPTETFYEYDSLGRPLSEVVRSEDNLILYELIYSDYQARSATFQVEDWGSINYGEVEFYDNNYISSRLSRLCFGKYTEDNTVKYYDEYNYTYDYLGRETGMRNDNHWGYTLYRDYDYSDKECWFYEDGYNYDHKSDEFLLVGSCKHYRKFY